MADTNVKFLKENHLYEAHKQFMRMAEGYGYAEPIEEAGDEDQPQDDGADPMGGDPSQGGAAPMGGPDPTAGGAPDAMGGAPDPSQGGGAPMGGDPSQGGADPMADGAPDAMSGVPDPMADPTGGVDPMSTPAPNGGDSDEEVIDVDDVVKAQEKTNDKVNDVGKDLGTVDRRIEKLLGALEDMQGVIDKNNAEIADLKNEFEKRNPTQTEKLNLRSLDSYPFNIRPTDYWKQKAMDGNYYAYADNDEPTTKEYTITNDDVRDVSDDIANTFDIPEDDIQDFNKIFNM